LLKMTSADTLVESWEKNMGDRFGFGEPSWKKGGIAKKVVTKGSRAR